LQGGGRERAFFLQTVFPEGIVLTIDLSFQNYSKETNQKPGAPPPHTTLQRHTKANRNVFIPRYKYLFVCCNNQWYYNIKDVLNSTFCFRFYYPFGKPESQQQWDTIVKTITDFFMSLPNSQASKHHFGQIAKVSNIV